MRRLVDQRTILVMPLTNAIAASINAGATSLASTRIARLSVRPVTHGVLACMQTVTARSINEIYRNRLLQLAVTFHGVPCQNKQFLA